MTIRAIEHPETWESCAIVNYIGGIIRKRDPELADRMGKQLHELHLIQDQFGPVRYNTGKLGPPKWEWSWYSIWEGENWRVYAGDEGTSIEIREGLNIDGVVDAWADYMSRLAQGPSFLR